MADDLVIVQRVDEVEEILLGRRALRRRLRDRLLLLLLPLLRQHMRRGARHALRQWHAR